MTKEERREYDKQRREKQRDKLVAASREWYYANRDRTKGTSSDWKKKNKERALKNLKSYQLKNFIYIKDYKAKYGCELCGIKNYLVLDFHHIDRKEKSFNIGCGKTASLDRIKKEIEKCKVLCRNCHFKFERGELELSGSKRSKRKKPRAGKEKFIFELKKMSGCSRCEEVFWGCLSFHHLDLESKKFNISQFSGRSLEDIKNEIAKCVILCSNCHIIEHATP